MARILALSLILFASVSAGVEEGRKAASSIRPPAPSLNAGNIPKWEGGGRDWSSGLDNGNIKEKAQEAMQESEIGQTVSETARTRQRFNFDTDNDPSFKRSNEALSKSDEGMEEEPEQGEEEGEGTTETCEEADGEYIARCSKSLSVTISNKKYLADIDLGRMGGKKTIEVDIVKYSSFPQMPSNVLLVTADKVSITGRDALVSHLPRHTVGSSNSWSSVGPFSGIVLAPKTAISGLSWWCGAMVERVRESFDFSEERIDTCQNLEKLADDGLCRFADFTQSPANETRMINGTPVTRDHWNQDYVYSCKHEVSDSGEKCRSLRARGCHQTGSKCIKEAGGVCVAWEQTLRCPSGKVKTRRYRARMDDSFLIAGEGATYEANTEFTEAMASLSVYSEAQKDIKGMKIFTGDARQCTKHMIGFSDCCNIGKGWGQSAGLKKCDGEDMALADLRGKGLCVHVGTYCAEKKAGVCIRKKTSFCCFPNKLSKVIQAGGRKQLGIDWGTPEHPTCERGFSIEEFSRIDISRIDKSEIFEDIKKSWKPKGNSELAATAAVDDIRKNMEGMAKGKVTE